MYQIIHDALTVDASKERPATFGKVHWHTLKDGPMKDYQKEILAHAVNYYDLSDMVGWEEWGHIAGIREFPESHQDKDEHLAAKTGEVRTPLCSCIYYHKVENLEGANLYLLEEDDESKLVDVIEPKTNMLVLLDPGVWHGISPYISGTRSTININPWDYHVQQK